MNKPTVNREVRLRVATPDDIPVLSKHHRMMFEEIWERKYIPTDPSGLASLEKEYAKKLTDEFQIRNLYLMGRSDWGPDRFQRCDKYHYVCPGSPRSFTSVCISP